MDILEENIPFMEGMAAPRKRGKTTLLVKQVKRFVQKKTFQRIAVLCQSLNKNHDYSDFRVDETKPENHLTKHEKYLKETFRFYPKPSQDDIRKLINMMSTIKEEVIRHELFGAGNVCKSCPQVLIILDDCLDTGLLNRQNIVDILAERGRHDNISVILTSQILKKVSLNIRLNCELMLFFSPFTFKELEKYLEEFTPSFFRTRVLRKIMEVFQKKHWFILIDSTEVDPLRKLKKGNADLFMKNQLETLLTDEDISSIYEAAEAAEMRQLQLTKKRKRTALEDKKNLAQ